MERELYDNLIDPEDNGKKVAPIMDYETEKALLSLCIRKKEALDTTINRGVSKDSFADKRNSLIFEAVVALYINSGSIDRFNVVEHLEHEGHINAAGGTEYVFSVADTPAVMSNIDSYISIVSEKSTRRLFIDMLKGILRDASSPKNDIKDLADLSIGKMMALREAPDETGFEALHTILKRNLNEIHSILNGKQKKSVTYTGFRGLDQMLGGLRPGTLNIIAARPGVGKTSLVINIATNVAVHKNSNVDIFSLEMSKSEVGNRILASRSDVTAKELSRAKISKEKETQLTKVFRELSELPIYIDDTSAVTPVKMYTKCEELKAHGKLGLVIVDYLQLMSGSDKGKNTSRQEEVASISRQLKVMAKDLQVPVIALAQLSRSSEKRNSERGKDASPLLSDLRDSGAIEQDADAVIFIDRDYYKKEDDGPVQDAKLIIAKNRHGETGVVRLKWWAEKTLFFEEDRTYDPVDPASTGSQSAYTRTTSSDASASDYKFDNEPVPPPFEEDVPPPEEPYSNPANDEYFEDSSTDFPEGF